jgi:hypothetical protein
MGIGQRWLITAIAMSAIAFPAADADDPFAFLEPAIQISAADRARIERGDTIVNILPSRPHEVALVAITPTTMTPERLAAWIGDVERLKATPVNVVHQVQQLSQHPALEEFSDLELPAEDIRDIRNCRPGSCEVKLTEAEMSRMRGEMQKAGPGWLARGNAVFREIAHDRVTSYLSGGLAALPPYADGHGEPSRAKAFAALVANSPYLLRVPALHAMLDHPRANGPEVTSFIYWSVEQLGAKAVASATQTIITTSTEPGAPAVISAGKQIYATHYSSASLNLVALVHRPAPGSTPYYLVVVNRTTIDAVGGMLGPITRRVVEGRMKRDAPGLVATFRRRIEAGPPR